MQIGSGGADAPLRGVRVLSLAEQLPGPYATLLLADLGADVILVERPGTGDPARFDPVFFDSLARNKRSVAIDLKSEGGREAFERLLATSDVLVEGFRPGVMDKLGLGREELCGRFPRLVYVSISGFGQDGPYRDRSGHDLSLQAISGLMFPHASDLSRPPEVPFADLASAMFAAFAVSTALFSRERTGAGSYVDVAMADSLVSWMTPLLAATMNGGAVMDTAAWPSYNTFRTADDRILSISIVHEDHLWRGLCRVLEMTDDAGLSFPERIARNRELRERIAERISRSDLAHWTRTFDGEGVCWSPVNSLADVVGDRHFQARDMLQTISVEGEEQRHVLQPLKFRGYRASVTRPAPSLGEHNGELLG